MKKVIVSFYLTILMIFPRNSKFISYDSVFFHNYDKLTITLYIYIF